MEHPQLGPDDARIPADTSRVSHSERSAIHDDVDLAPAQVAPEETGQSTGQTEAPTQTTTEPSSASVPSPELTRHAAPESAGTAADANADVEPGTPRLTLRQRFRRWRRTRPFAGGLLTMLGGLIVLAGPLSLIRLAVTPGSTVPVGLTVGALIVLMGLFQWITPFYSLMAGAVTVVLSLVSLLTASFGGLVIGMLLSLTGGALAVAWRPAKAADAITPTSPPADPSRQLPPPGTPAASA
jgi:hypothetical protein